MRRDKLFALVILITTLPITSVSAQDETHSAVFFYGSVINDQTTRPPTLNPSCWTNETTGGFGVSLELRNKSPFAIEVGYRYLGAHKNDMRCAPQMELRTSVIPLTIAYLIPVGNSIVIAPKIGISYMFVEGDFGTQTSRDSSIDPTFGLFVEGTLSRRWGLRWQVDRYTGRTTLFGLGTFNQDFWVTSFGGVVKW